MSVPMDTVLERLDRVKANGSGYTARCPAHDDRNPSLSITEGDGQVLLYCHAGCRTEDVVAAMGLEMRDLFLGSSRNGKPKKYEWEIKDPEGSLVAIHHRIDLPDGKKQVWWTRPDGSKGLGGKRTGELPLYGCERIKEEDELVAIAEEEKATDALIEAGIPACGTVTGAAGTPDRAVLDFLAGKKVTLWPDNDEEGRSQMKRVAEALRGVASEVRIYEGEDQEGLPKKGADAADHPGVTARATEYVRVMLEEAPIWKPPESKPKENFGTFTAAELLTEELPEARWAIPDVLPEGVTFLAGKPKMGKSWMALGIGIAVATGGVALGTKRVEQGEVLYLALEDNKRRLQRRLKKLLAGGVPPDRLHIALTWPRADQGGVKQLEEFLREHPQCRLVIIDTLARFKPRAHGRRTQYDEDRDAVDPLIPIADEHNVAIVIVHHLREAESDDPLDLLYGSAGLTGGVDGALVLKRERSRADAFLYVEGRDIENPTELALNFDPNAATWAIVGDAEEYRMSEQRRTILRVLLNADESLLGPKEITPMVNAMGVKMNEGAVRETLSQMFKDGQVKNPRRGKYGHPDRLQNLPDNTDILTNENNGGLFNELDF